MRGADLPSSQHHRTGPAGSCESRGNYAERGHSDSWLAQLNSITEVLDPRQSPGLRDLAHEVRRWAE
ncbi:hypothetical protein Pd630_LPD01810 [Rhodococcus opacus PD630]|nr:hypothetical protein Pd630_LPD01810 [Rhodococcus opacus PD630]